MRTLYLIGMVICGVGSLIFGDKLQRIEIEEEVNKRLSGDTDEEKGGD